MATTVVQRPTTAPLVKVTGRTGATATQTTSEQSEAISLGHDEPVHDQIGGDQSTMDIETSLIFTQRDDRLQDEKPYMLRYRDLDFPQTNQTFETVKSIIIKDMRPQISSLSLEHQGFAVLKQTSHLTREEFLEGSKVQDVYLEELRELLQQRYGADRVEFIRHNVRQRHVEFPVADGGRYAHDQPAQLAHIDITTERAISIVENMFGDDVQGLRRFNFVNIWKPLRGPLEDWPLAVCDASTTDYAHDVMSADVVWPDEISDNCTVFYGPRQQWYYLSRQQPDELLVFRQMDSLREENNGTLHTAVFNPAAPPDADPRESVEVQAILLYGEGIAQAKRLSPYPVYKH